MHPSRHAQHFDKLRSYIVGGKVIVKEMHQLCGLLSRLQAFTVHFRHISRKFLVFLFPHFLLFLLFLTDLKQNSLCGLRHATAAAAAILCILLTISLYSWAQKRHVARRGIKVSQALMLAKSGSAAEILNNFGIVNNLRRCWQLRCCLLITVCIRTT